MKQTVLILIFCATGYFSSCQTAEENKDFNFGFEKISENARLPDDWIQWGEGDYLKIDSAEKYSGKASMQIELGKNAPPAAFGCVAYLVPAIYQGEEIELRAYLKAQDVAANPVGLVLRIDGEMGPLQSENLMKKKIQGTADWALYSIKLPLPRSAKTIYIGAILSGTGKLWIDDFQLLIDGKDIGQAKPKEPVLYQAENDKEFDKGSKIMAIELTPSKVGDLDILGKVWGFLKYYHPAIANGDYNWDYELFRILPTIIGSKNTAERNAVLSAWIDKLGKVKKGSYERIESSKIKINPDLSWIKSTDLGRSLTRKLMRIKGAERKNEHYYIGLTPGVGNPQFQHENPYWEMPYPDAGFRLLALFRYWNMIQYYFPYKNLIEEDWKDVLPEFIPEFVNAKDELEYKLAVLSLIARIHDTHANIWGQDWVLREYKGENYAPLEITFIEDQAVVTGYLNPDLGKATGLQKGDVIERVNGSSVADIIQERLPYTPASNYPTQLRDIASGLLRTNDTVLSITYRRGDSAKVADIPCVSFRDIDPNNKYLKQDTCFRFVAPGIAYLYPGRIKNEYLPEIMPQILKSKGLIIDFRCYPSDFFVFTLSEYLLKEPTDFVTLSMGSIHTPGLFTFRNGSKAGKDNSNFYRGKVVIIVNETTQSSAEYHTLAFRTAPNATVIGSTTAGADGNVSQFYLPGGIRSMISGIGVYYPDGRETQRIGIVPDIEIKPTIQGILEGRDELLEKAIEIINDGK